MNCVGRIVRIVGESAGNGGDGDVWRPIESREESGGGRVTGCSRCQCQVSSASAGVCVVVSFGGGWVLWVVWVFRGKGKAPGFPGALGWSL